MLVHQIIVACQEHHKTGTRQERLAAVKRNPAADCHSHTPQGSLHAGAAGFLHGEMEVVEPSSGVPQRTQRGLSTEARCLISPEVCLGATSGTASPPDQPRALPPTLHQVERISRHGAENVVHPEADAAPQQSASPSPNVAAPAPGQATMHAATERAMCLQSHSGEDTLGAFR